MKRLFSCIALAVLFAICSCTYRESDIPTPKVSFMDTVAPSYNSAVMKCIVRGNVTVESLIIEYSDNESFSASKTQSLSLQDGVFSAILTGLESRTEYYYRYSIENSINAYRDEKIRSFSTLEYTVPSVSTVEVERVYASGATLWGTLSSGKPIIEKGFFVGEDNQDMKKYICQGTDFSITFDNLDGATTYYYQAYAESEVGIGTGEIKSFTTLDLSDFLTFEVITGGTITWTATGSSYRIIEYSKDKGRTWTAIESSNSGVSVPVSSQEVLYFRGDNDGYAINGDNYNCFGVEDGASFYAYGPVTSLLNVNYRNTLRPWAFAFLFDGCSGLVSHPQNHLYLPSEGVSEYCYLCMFRGCLGLIKAPDLPATQLARSCYSSMFCGCSSLISTPALPATQLAPSCYSSMFYGCSSLISTPALPATQLARSCYSYMFYRCSSLISTPALPATQLASYCYNTMFGECYSLIRAPELPATYLAESCYYEMFYNCLSLTQAPELPATQLAESCYKGMFIRCPKLNYVKCLATDISGTECTFNWLLDVSMNGTFVKDKSMKDWEIGPSGIPQGWTIKDN